MKLKASTKYETLSIKILKIIQFPSLKKRSEDKEALEDSTIAIDENIAPSAAKKTPSTRKTTRQ